MGHFIELHPETEVVLQSSVQLADLLREPVDVGIRFGLGLYPGMWVEKLMGDYFYPVASPHYNDGRLPAAPAQLAECNLLRSDNEHWMPWFEAAGLALPEPSRGLVMQDSAMLIRAAVAGEGVALARHVIAAQEVIDGKLVRLFDTVVESANAYYFACAPHALQKPQVKAFHLWLREEVARFREQAGWDGRMRDE